MSQDYEAFVEKFKPKKTTDDCYTPEAVYDAVKNWVVKEYHLEGRPIVRPFYPGGDFEAYKYPPNGVVIDNPPFSILARIKEFYQEQGLPYFLFAPHLMLFSANTRGASYLITDADIVYENGAVVNTSFVTNLESSFIRTAPALRQAIDEAVQQIKATKKKPRYAYPDTVISPALLGRIATVDFQIASRDSVHFVRALEHQRREGKSIFGGGYLISERLAAERRAAEHRAAERLAAERRAAERRAAEPKTQWELSETEKEIIRGLV